MFSFYYYVSPWHSKFFYICLQVHFKTNNSTQIVDTKKSGKNIKLRNIKEKRTKKLQKALKHIKKKKEQLEEHAKDNSVIEHIENIKNKKSIIDLNSENPAKINKTPYMSKVEKGKKCSTITENRDEIVNLPDGWIKKVVVRKSGKSAGHSDIYYFR